MHMHMRMRMHMRMHMRMRMHMHMHMHMQHAQHGMRMRMCMCGLGHAARGASLLKAHGRHRLRSGARRRGILRPQESRGGPGRAGGGGGARLRHFNKLVLYPVPDEAALRRRVRLEGSRPCVEIARRVSHRVRVLREDQWAAVQTGRRTGVSAQRADTHGVQSRGAVRGAGSARRVRPNVSGVAPEATGGGVGGGELVQRGMVRTGAHVCACVAARCASVRPQTRLRVRTARAHLSRAGRC
jgi:hypothetical protein